MARHTENERVLRDGQLVVYQRTDVAKANWHCRIKFPDHPYIRKSLKCQSEAEALRKANKLYDDLRYRLERGLALNSPPFSKAIDAYLEWLENQIEEESDNAKSARLIKKLKDHRKFSQYAREYFDTRPVDQITEIDIEQYREWRKSYWTRGPGSARNTIEYVRNGRTVKAPRPKSGTPALSTLASEDVVLRSVFDRARKLGWIMGDQIPQIKSARATSTRRPDFTEAQLQRLLRIADERTEDAPNDHVRYLRGMLADFCGLLAFTGMRPFEAMKLEWRDIATFKTEASKLATKIRVSGKNKERTLVARDEATHYVFSINERVSAWRNGGNEDGIEVLTGPVFVMPDGSPIKSFKKGLRALLDAAGLRRDDHSVDRDAYSFRHYYATQRLLAGISVYTLRENMGTSVAMIEKHYGHVRPELAADELTRE